MICPFLFIRAKDLAHRWQVSVVTLHNWRLSGQGPGFIKIKGSIRYKWEDIHHFENGASFQDSCKVDVSSSTEQEGELS